MDDKEFLKSLGERIRSLRKSRNMSQELLAELSELHPTHISKLERGVVKIYVTNLNKIARGLNIPLSELLNFPSKKSKEKDLITQRIFSLLRKQDFKTLEYFEKTIHVYLDSRDK